MIRFADVVTWVLHPVLLALLAVYMITLQSTSNNETAFYWTFISFLFALAISLFVLFGVKKGFFNNIDISNRRQRVIAYPFSIGVVLMFGTLVYLINGPSELILGSVLFIIALIVLDLINRKIKASVHVASVAALITGTVYLYAGFSYILLLLIPLVAWARIVKKRHTYKETVVGAVCGIVLTLSAINIVQFLINNGY